MLEELGNARLDSQESRRQLQRKELLEKLRRLYPESVVRDNEKGSLLECNDRHVEDFFFFGKQKTCQPTKISN